MRWALRVSFDQRADVILRAGTGAAWGQLVAVRYYMDAAGKDAVCLVIYDVPRD